MDWLAQQREVELEGSTYTIRPATVREALEIIALSERQDLEGLRRVAMSWLPRELFSKVSDLGPFIGGVLSQLLADGHKLSSEKRVKIDYLAEIVDVSRTTSTPIQDVLSWSWPFFLAVLAKSPVVRARDGLAYIRAKSLGHIKSDAERRRAFDQLYDDAARYKAEITEEEQRATLDNLKNMMQ
jgi:hypothetical protein